MGTWHPARFKPPQSFLVPNVGHEEFETRIVISRGDGQNMG